MQRCPLLGLEQILGTLYLGVYQSPDGDNLSGGGRTIRLN